MRKTKRTGLFLTLCMLLTAAIYLLSGNITRASEVTRPDEYYFVFNGQQKKAGTEYEMKNQEVLLNITAGTWEPETKVQWVSSEPGVIQLEETSYGSNFIKLVRKGPGYSTITAVVTQGTNSYSISCLVKIDLEFDYQKTGMTTATTTSERVLVMNDDSPPRQVYLKYLDYIPEGETEPVSGSAISFSTVTWESDNESVATVDEKGIVTAVGSGSAKITVTTNTMSSQNKSLSKSMRVVVSPTFTLTYDDTEGNRVEKISDKSDSNFTPAEGVPTRFVLESNATYANNLKWEIYDSSTGKILPVKNNKLQYTINENSGNVTFTGVKAGTYEIYAFANDKYTKYTNVPYAYMKIIVPIYLGNQDIVMNVGDTYSITDNSNIHSFSIFEASNVEPGGANIARVNPTTGVITARKSGTTTIRLEYKTPSKLYDNDSVFVDEMFIKVTVIDGISLSATEANLYTSGTLQLYAKLTDPASEVTWSSDAPNIAKVEDGLVTALRPGIAIITAQITTQGVVKKATCEITVLQSVTNITIDPATLNIAIGEYQTLHAMASPKLSNVKLNWQSSNEKVVKIVEKNPLTVTIQGVAGGNAVISAINEDNIVVGYTHVTVRQPVTSIRLSDTKVTINLDAKSIQLRAFVYPENALNKEVKWTSSDTSIARVNNNGLVTFSRPGEVTIIATSVDNPDVMALCNITIEIPVETVALDDKEITMYVGQTKRLSYSVLPINASKNAVTWTSTNSGVASVDAQGRVTARKVGTAVIMVKTLDGGHTAYCTVNVRQIAEGVKFNQSELKLQTGQVHELEYTLIPNNATDVDLLWESSDTKVAVVDERGRVTAKGPGTAFVIVRTEAGGMSYIKVTVSQPVQGLLLNFSEKTIYVGERFELKASVSPSEASNLEVTWTSSNTRIATVSEKGEVIGVAPGTTIITCTTKEGKFTASCVLTVRNRLTSMSLNYEEYKLGINKSVVLSVVVDNEIVTDLDFRWVSSNEDVASVNKKGKVTAHKLGTAVITAYALDGSGQDASCEIEVVRPVTKVTLNKSFMSMLVGESKELKAKIEPKNATYKGAIWTSSDNSIAIVDEDGVVTGLKEGSVTITAQAQDNSGKKATSYITVYNRVPATSVVVSDKKIVMIQGEQRTVKPVLNPVNSTDGLTWSTDNSAVASVNEKTGVIKARSTGTAYITVMTDSGKTATIEVSVIGLNVTNLELEQYSRYTLKVEGATSRVTWDVANPKIAEVKNGVVISKARGTTTITATVNGRKLTCKLTVVKIK